MSFTRRRFVKTIAGASAIASAPRSFGECHRPSTPRPPVPGTWSNWTGSEPTGPQLKFVPTSLSELVGIVDDATSSTRLKASGSRWSDSGAARTESKWIDTSALTGIISDDLTALADQFTSDRENLVLVRAGTKIHWLAEELWRLGKSIPTLGGSMGQSIAGAISTGTHGSDIGLPPIAGMVRAIHLVGPGGCEFWLEHPARPVASRSSLNTPGRYADWNPEITTFRNADAFNAALVSAGRCGVIYAYVLEVEPAFQLRHVQGESTWRNVRAHLQRAADSGDWVNFIRTNNLPFSESTAVVSNATPCAITTGSKLSLMWKGRNNPGQFRWIHQDRNSGDWSRKFYVDDNTVRRSAHRPAIAYFNGRYYVAWTGTNPDPPYVHLIRSNPTGEFWQDHIKFDEAEGQPEAKSSEGPVLLAANGKLHIVWVGEHKPGEFRWITSTDGLTWGGKEILAEPGLSRVSNLRPAIAFFEDRYYLAWKGSNDSFVHMIRSNLVSASNPTGRPWTNYRTFSGTSTRPKAETRDAPCLLAANDKLHLVWVGTENPGQFRWLVSSGGTVWTDKRILNDGQTRQSNVVPDMIFQDGQYHLFWTGHGGDENIYVMRSTTGETWTRREGFSVPPGPSVDMQAIRALEVTFSPESANGAAWWTTRTKVGLNQPPTRLTPAALSFAEQRLLVDVLSKALDPNRGPPYDQVLRFLTGLLLQVGGVPGGALSEIIAAIALGQVAGSRDIFLTIADLIYRFAVETPATVGRSYQISSGNAVKYGGSYEQMYREFWNNAPKAHFTEIFFNGQSSNYLRFIDQMLSFFQTNTAKQAGYVSIRFMASSDAPLAMQHWPVTAAVELIIIQGFDPNARRTIEAVNDIARNFDARFHLGMLRPANFRTPDIESDLERWKTGARLLLVRRNDSLSSEFSRASGLEP